MLGDVDRDEVVTRFSTGLANSPFCFSDDGELFAFPKAEGSSVAVFKIASRQLTELPIKGTSRHVQPIGFVTRDLLAVRQHPRDRPPFYVWNLKTNAMEFTSQQKLSHLKNVLIA